MKWEHVKSSIAQISVEIFVQEGNHFLVVSHILLILFRKILQRYCILIYFVSFSWILFFSAVYKLEPQKDATHLFVIMIFCDGHAEFCKYKSERGEKKISFCTRFIRSIFKRIVKEARETTKERRKFFVCFTASQREEEFCIQKYSDLLQQV